MNNEVWMNIPIKGYSEYYLISNAGRIKSVRMNTIMKQHIDKNGYCRIGLTSEGNVITKGIHRLVAITFIPNPQNKECVCHKDDDPSNNNVDNLFWGTRKENSQDMVNKGRWSGGAGMTNKYKNKHGLN